VSVPVAPTVVVRPAVSEPKPPASVPTAPTVAVRPAVSVPAAPTVAVRPAMSVPAARAVVVGPAVSVPAARTVVVRPAVSVPVAPTSVVRPAVPVAAPRSRNAVRMSPTDRSPTMRHLIGFLLVTSLLAACASSSAPPAGTPGASSCEALQAAASGVVEQAIASHAGCSEDKDCVTVGIGAGCFDHCSRNINADGMSDLRAAQERVGGAQCREFSKRGCQLIPPPCAATPPPRCKAGLCV
jgi:hypothetical protein